MEFLEANGMKGIYERAYMKDIQKSCRSLENPCGSSWKESNPNMKACEVWHLNAVWEFIKTRE